MQPFSNFELAWNNATLLAHITAKHSSDLTLLKIDNQYPFLQCNAGIFISASGDEMTDWVILHFKLILNNFPVLISVLYFISRLIYRILSLLERGGLIFSALSIYW